MATQPLSTPAHGAHLDPAATMLAKLFPRWRGDASEPALQASRPNRPAPAASVARQLVEA